MRSEEFELIILTSITRNAGSESVMNLARGPNTLGSDTIVAFDKALPRASKLRKKSCPENEWVDQQRVGLASQDQAR